MLELFTEYGILLALGAERYLAAALVASFRLHDELHATPPSPRMVG
mgnify:CR=1 FL=1